MSTCFVIQPFDGGKFDKRYQDIFAPAIEASGLEPYRVDQDPSVSIPIEDIEAKIQASTACLADITIDNPNVWFELGIAIAAGKEVVLVCSDERTDRFPFDVQHRSIIQYSTDSVSDYEELREQITRRLDARLQRRRSLEQVTHMPPEETVGSLKPHELAALVAIAGSIDRPQDVVSRNDVRTMMASAGFEPIATFLALDALTAAELLDETEVHEEMFGTYLVYQLSRTGFEFLENHADRLVLRKSKPAT